MGDVDVDALLEEALGEKKKPAESETAEPAREHAEKNGHDKVKEKDHKEKSSKDKDSSSKDKKKDKDKDREKEKKSEKKSKRDRSRSKERKRKRSGSRDKDEKKEKEKKKDKDKEKDKDDDKEKDKDEKKDKEKDKKRSRSRSPRRRRSEASGKSERRRSRSRSPLRRNRSRSRDRSRRSERLPLELHCYGSPVRGDRWSDMPGGGRRLPGPERRDVMPFTPRHTPPRAAKHDLSLEERDARTVFIMQLSHRTRPRDLEEFFSSVGKVRDVRIITDSKTRRSKGIAYVEFWESESVPLAIGLNGQKLLNAPLVIQATQAERNRAANGMVGGVTGFQVATPMQGPMRLYVGSLHFNITEDMLRGIFEPFGRVDSLQIMKEDNGTSRGYGFVTFRHAEDAKRAMDQLNGFELAGRPIKVGHVNEPNSGNNRSLDNDDSDRTGVDLGTSGRLQLMAKLAEGTGLALPNQAQQVLSMSQQQNTTTPAIATQCFMLSNMFDPAKLVIQFAVLLKCHRDLSYKESYWNVHTETEPNWEQDIRDDVIEECNKHGGVLHIYVDKQSADGNVYVKCPSVSSAVASVNSLHGRWFAGKVITANYVPVNNYHQLFSDALKAVVPLQAGYAPSVQPSGPAGGIY